MPGNWGRAGDGLRVSVTVVLNPQGPGRTGWGGGRLPNRGRRKSSRVYGSALRLGLDAVGGN